MGEREREWEWERGSGSEGVGEREREREWVTGCVDWDLIFCWHPFTTYIIALVMVCRRVVGAEGYVMCNRCFSLVALWKDGGRKRFGHTIHQKKNIYIYIYIAAISHTPAREPTSTCHTDQP